MSPPLCVRGVKIKQVVLMLWLSLLSYGGTNTTDGTRVLGSTPLIVSHFFKSLTQFQLTNKTLQVVELAQNATTPVGQCSAGLPQVFLTSIDKRYRFGNNENM